MLPTARNCSANEKGEDTKCESEKSEECVLVETEDLIGARAGGIRDDQKVNLQLRVADGERREKYDVYSYQQKDDAHHAGNVRHNIQNVKMESPLALLGVS